jgi:hypothetical protein
MGDIPQPVGAPNEFTTEDGAINAYPGPTSPSQRLQHAQGHLGAYQSAAYSPQNYGTPQHAFSTQLDMAQSQGQGRGGPYNMSAIANALPQQNYRPGQYSQNQQRFGPQNASPLAVPTPMPLQQQQYEGQHGINPLANQQYYLPQHASGIPQYYPTSMSPPQLQTNASPRPNMQFYPSPVIINPQAPGSAPFFYQHGQFGVQAQSTPTQVMSSQYLGSTPPQSDPRLAAALPSDHYGISAYAQDRGSSKSCE